MPTSEASRQILWNLDSISNATIMYGLFVLSLAIGFIGIYRHVEFWRAGADEPSYKSNFFRRFSNLVSWAMLQRGVVREKRPAVAHTLIYVGFLVLLFTTTMVLIDHDFGIKIYHGEFYLGITVLSDLLGLGVLVGCALAAHRRYLSKPDQLHNKLADSSMLIVLSLLIIQGFLLEGLRIHATNDPWAAFSPIGNLVSKFFWSLSYDSTTILHFIIWWFHTITVFLVVALLPYTKFFHIVTSIVNLYFKDSSRAKGALKNPGDIETLIETEDEISFGLGSIEDYSWKERMDLDACTSCGRCQDVCPAYLAEKPLSPKWVILDTRNHALALQAEDKISGSCLPKSVREMDGMLTKKMLLQQSGVTKPADTESYQGNGEFRAANKLVQESVKSLGGASDDTISGAVIDPEVFWSCTTCMACVEACPVGINHVDQIVGNRRHMVLMEGSMPQEAQKTLRDLENRANPYGAPEDRINWLKDLDVRILEAGDSVDYLYWVGCVSAFDPRKQKIAQALVRLMKRAGLNFGVLGTAEGCSGDPARRLGEENLFQMLTKNNLEILNSISFKYLVANCPHCFNTIKNEYPQFGNIGNGLKPKVIHHSVLLKNLIKERKIQLSQSEEEITFHDPCYLGRYNDEYDAPREALYDARNNIVEMERSREKGMCCGAGGGHFWMDLKTGERINSIRVDQAAETGVKQIATACPFCLQMMEDGVKLTNREGELEVKDIAEILDQSSSD